MAETVNSLDDIFETLFVNSEERQCDLHGQYTSRLFKRTQHWTSCPRCEDDRRQNDDAAEQQRMARERAEFAAKQALTRACIPPRFLNSTFDSFITASEDEDKALTTCQTYADEYQDVLARGRCLVMYGLKGTGKTHLACAIGHAFLGRNKSVVYTTAAKLIRTIKETWDHHLSERTERQAYEIFTKPDLLIIDEAGTQFNSDSERLILFNVINDRYEHPKPTIVVTNGTLKELEGVIGSPSMDRLRECGHAVLFRWDSKRGKL